MQQKQRFDKLQQYVSGKIIGQTELVNRLLVAMLADGHLLVEGAPGLAKTRAIQVLSEAVEGDFHRVQFTPDLLPADITGTEIFQPQTGEFEFRKGPLFHNLVLADEINRAPAKVQSALLEAMEEGRVSVDGVTHQLPEPFFVIATQNPMSHAGTYPLPESQLDRFMMRLSLGFPNIDAERQILQSLASHRDMPTIDAFLDTEQLRAIQQHIASISVAPAIVDYVIALCRISRQYETQAKALSPRAGKALIAAAKSWAFMENRDYVIPDDIQAVFSAVCEHRLAPQQHHIFDEANELSQQILSQVDPINPLP